MQILSGILIEAQNDELRLAATDMEISLRATVAAHVEGDGVVVLPGKTLADIARLLPADEVTIEHRPDGVGRARDLRQRELHAEHVQPRGLPAPARARRDPDVHVDRESLLETIGRVARAASRDESRPVLTGILVHFEGGKLVMAATDSYRLAVKETALEGPPPDLEAIVPGRALQELARIATSGDEVEIGVHENQVSSPPPASG